MVVSDASEGSAPEDTMDLIAAMGALGLPTSFLSRFRVQEKASKKPSNSKLRPSGPKEAVEAEPEPPALFSVRSVQLFSAKEPAPEEITLKRLKGLELDYQAIEGESPFAGLESRISDQDHRRDDVELAHYVDDSGAKLIYSELEAGEVSSSGVTWEPVWDEQYQRYYFCNAQTWESTWDPPLGYEHYGASPVEWSECSSVDPSQHAHHSEISCIDPSSTGSYVGSSKQDMDQGLGDHVEADEVQEHGTSPFVRQHVNETDGWPKANGLDGEHDLSERHGSFDVIMGGEGEEVEGERTCATLAKSAVMNSCQGSAVQSSTMTKGSQSIESLPVFPRACGLHTRFSDSDDSSTDAEDNGEINWGEIGEPHSVAITSDGHQDETEACSLSLENGTLTATKRLVKRRRVKSLSESEKLEKVLLPGMAEVMSKSLIKYWLQRYSLFSRYDEGIKLDEEGWFSVTPEAIAEHHALRCPMGLVIDAFTGVGGNAIQFALKNNPVIAIDIDPTRVELARHNAKIYGVADRIEFIVGDFFLLAPSMKADYVFLSPPWGGPEYLNQEKYNIQTMLQPKDGFTLFKVAQAIAPNLALFLPRNVDLAQLQELSWLSSPPLPCEVEKNYVDNRLKAITAYYGEVADQSRESQSFIPA